jgi:phosphoserine phosphatase
MSYINPEYWMPESPFDVFFLDWDSTISLIEGIDFLAGLNGVEKQVHAITQRCMATTGLSIEDYRKRLDLIKPTKIQMQQLAQAYRAHLAPGARDTIKLLQDLGKTLYVLSGGIKEAIVPLAEELGIHQSNVLAVDVYFNESGAYEGFDELSELVQANGKSKQIAQVLKAKERSLLIGDGFTDWEAQSSVTRFIGYSGLHPKAWVKEHAEFFITQTSIFPLLALGLTDTEQARLKSEDKLFYEAGIADIQKGLVLIKGYDYVHYSNS